MFVAVLLSFLALSSAQVSDTNTIVENAQQVSDLSTLVTVLTTPGYEPILNALNSAGTYTVFAPTNAAFTAAGVNVSDVDMVSQVLYYHVLGATVASGDLAALQFPETLMTDQMYVTLGSGNGQVAAVSKTGDAVTVSYGIPGEAASTANVVTADVNCTNGVVHVIDSVMMFPLLTSETAVAAGLSSLVSAVVASNLTDAIDTTPGITVFAPTNDAFTAFTAAYPDLTEEELVQVLQYHVVPSVAFSTDLSDGMEVATLLDSAKLEIHIHDGEVEVVGAKSYGDVAVANALTQNGVVHVIDAVLVPASISSGASMTTSSMTLVLMLFAALFHNIWN